MVFPLLLNVSGVLPWQLEYRCGDVGEFGLEYCRLACLVREATVNQMLMVPLMCRRQTRCVVFVTAFAASLAPSRAAILLLLAHGVRAGAGGDMDARPIAEGD